jgi:hypothetical protein
MESDASWLPVALGIAGTLVGVIVGAVLTQIWTGLRESRARRYHFVERQVQELYAPLMGLRKDIRAKSELRLKISQKATVVWQELVADKNPAIQLEIEKTRLPAFKAIIKYDNQQLTEELLPDYRTMLEIFKANYALA